MAKKKRVILVVEDEADLREQYATKCASMPGTAVLVAKDGVEAVEKILHDKPDIVLLDVMLPLKDGFSILQEMKQNAKVRSIPVIMLTNLGNDFEREQGLRLGAARYLVKTSVTPGELVEVVNEVLKENKKK